jgi:CBS-domain-containing membrane protein
MNLNEYTISLKAHMSEAVKQILNSNERTVFVLDSDRKLIGVLSEGDILRALNSGVLMSTHVLNIMNPSPFFSTKLLDGVEFIRIYLEKGIQLVPIIDSEGRIIKIQSLGQVLELY